MQKGLFQCFLVAFQKSKISLVLKVHDCHVRYACNNAAMVSLLCEGQQCRAPVHPGPGLHLNWHS